MTATNAAGRHGGSANFKRRLRRWAAKAVNATRSAKRLVEAIPEPAPAPAPADDEGTLGASGEPLPSADTAPPSVPVTAGALRDEMEANGESKGESCQRRPTGP